MQVLFLCGSRDAYRTADLVINSRDFSITYNTRQYATVRKSAAYVLRYVADFPWIFPALSRKCPENRWTCVQG